MDLVKQGLDIITGGVVEYGKSYINNTPALVRDAVDVANTIKEDAVATYDHMKNSGTIRHLMDWFKNKGDETEPDGDDEFDPGVDFGDGDESESREATLDRDSMEDISNKQVNAMYRIGGKQAEVSVANTAEVVDMMKKNNGMTIQVLNQMQKSVNSILEKLDNIAKINASAYQTLEKKSYKDSGDFLDASGNVDLSKVYEYVKNDSTAAGLIGVGSMFLESMKSEKGGILGGLLSMGLDKLGDSIKPFGNDKSVNEIIEGIDKTVHATIQSTIANIMDSKLFGSMNSMSADKDYGKLTTNQYNNKPAVFDGMTRYSIVNIIPEYLKKIHETLSGQSYSIDDKGHLTTEAPKNHFQSVTRNAFSSSGLDYDFKSNVTKDLKSYDDKIKQRDIDDAGKALTMVYVMYLHKNGKRMLRANQINPSDTSVIREAAETLSFATGKTIDYWEPIVMNLMMHLSMNIVAAQEFVQNVNVRLKSMVEKATDFAMNNVYAEQASKISFSMAANEFKADYQERHKWDKIDDEEENDKKKYKGIKGAIQQYTDEQKKKENKKTSGEVEIDKPQSFSKTTSHGLFDYVKGIFGILNRGINVFDTSITHRDKPYPDFPLSGPQPSASSSNEAPSFKPFKPEDGKEGEVTVSDPKGESAVDSIVNAIAPEGSSLRLGMQFFGNVLGVPKKGEKNDPNEPTPYNAIQEAIKPIKENLQKTSEAVLGQKVETTDSEGNTEVKRVNGIVQGVQKKINNEINNVRADVTEWAEKEKAKTEYNRTVKAVNKMDVSNEDDKQDQLAAQQVFALMQTATGDGGASDQEIDRVNSAIENIKNPELKSRVKRSVIPMLKNSGTNDDGKKKNSVIGKIVTMALTGIKKIFSPITKLIRVISIGVKSIGGKIFNLISKPIKFGFKMIKTGLSNTWRGLFGQKSLFDENGNQTRAGDNGLIGKFISGPINKVTQSIKSMKSSISEHFNSFKTSVKGVFGKSDGGNTGEGGEEDGETLTDKVKEKIEEKKEEKEAKAAAEGEAEAETEGDQKPGGFFKRIGESDFMKGFTSVFKEIKDKEAAKKKEALKNKEPETYTENKLEELMGVATGTTESIFSKICNIAQEIQQKICSDTETPPPENNSGGENNDESNGNNNGEANGDPNPPPGNNEGNNGNNGSSSGNDSTTTTGSNDGNGGGSGDGNSGQKKGLFSRIKGVFGGGGDFGGGGLGGVIDSVSSMFNLGQTIGGIASTLGGVVTILTTIMGSIEGFKVVTDLIQETLTQSLQPLQGMFDALKDAIAPVINTVGTVISTIAEAISGIGETIVGLIVPIMQSIQPLIQLILDFVKPILDVVNALVKVILAPLMGIIQHRITPIIKSIGNHLEIIMGVLQVGMGLIVSALGGILMGVGFVVRFLTMNSSVYEQGKSMWDMGTGMISGGIESVKSGITNQIQLIKDTVDPLGIFHETEKEKESKKDRKKIDPDTAVVNGSVMDGLTGSGDANNQRAYGNYMNMGERGCGPIALSDVYARRTGYEINPRVLATRMRDSGAYDPQRGTSVGQYVSMANAMGIPMRVGGVSQQSLRRATPQNPVTVIGSGSDYATKSGNNHYMNVIGTDRSGMAYVMNPLNGRVSKTPTSSVVGSTALGIYGSGDSDDNLFHFSDETKAAMQSLKNMVNNIVDMFSFEKSNEEEINELVNAEAVKEQESKISALESSDPDKYKEYYDSARSKFEEENPKRDGESDEEYEERWEKKKSAYIMQEMATGQQEGYNSIRDSIAGTIDKFTNGDFINAMDTGFNSIESENGSSSGVNGQEGTFTSKGGAILATKGYTPSIFETDLTKSLDNSPVHEFFSKLSGVLSGTTSWWKRRNDPDKVGEGQSGDDHEGIDITFTKDRAPLYPTTDGEVVVAGKDGEYSGTGNVVSWKDFEGNYHTYMHMADAPKVKAGDIVQGGSTLLGYVGNTGWSTGPHLHYQIGTGPWAKNSVMRNPLTYFNWNPRRTSGKGKIDIPDPLLNKSAWDAYKTKDGVRRFIDMAMNSGLSAAQTAAIISTGIWEDSGEKIFGAKSLTDVTYDKNGQQATGIMNWMDTDVNYGNTVGDQLRYIRDAYMTYGATHWTAKVREPNRSNQEPVFQKMAGYPFHLKEGDKYGTYMNTDLLEGMTHFIGSSLVPEDYANESGIGRYVGTAADAYNWMYDAGIVDDMSSVNKATSTGPSNASDANREMVKNQYQQALAEGTFKPNSASDYNLLTYGSTSGPKTPSSTTSTNKTSSNKKVTTTPMPATDRDGNPLNDSYLPNDVGGKFKGSPYATYPKLFVNMTDSQKAIALYRMRDGRRDTDPYVHLSKDNPTTNTQYLYAEKHEGDYVDNAFKLYRMAAADVGVINAWDATGSFPNRDPAVIGGKVSSSTKIKYMNNPQWQAAATQKFQVGYPSSTSGYVDIPSLATTTSSNQHGGTSGTWSDHSGTSGKWSSAKGGTWGSGDAPFLDIFGNGDPSIPNVATLTPEDNTSFNKFDSSKVYANIFGNGNVGTSQPKTIEITKVIQKEDNIKSEYIQQILENEYRVYDPRVEKLLSKIIELLDKEDDDNDNVDSGGTRVRSNQSNPKMFDDKPIPQSIVRLYK